MARFQARMRPPNLTKAGMGLVYIQSADRTSKQATGLYLDRTSGRGCGGGRFDGARLPGDSDRQGIRQVHQVRGLPEVLGDFIPDVRFRQQRLLSFELDQQLRSLGVVDEPLCRKVVAEL